jgi:hypothetical protein
MTVCANADEENNSTVQNATFAAFNLSDMTSSRDRPIGEPLLGEGRAHQAARPSVHRTSKA